MLFEEIKRHLNKPDERYVCHLVYRDASRVVLQYVSDRAWTVAGVVLPAGSTTDALYREGEGFVLWRMATPDGRIAGHLFHVCSELRLAARQVRYLDLLLDIWVDATGAIAILDREEVDACRRDGRLTAAQDGEILRQEKRILAQWHAFAAELAGIAPAD